MHGMYSYIIRISIGPFNVLKLLLRLFFFAAGCQTEMEA